MMHLPQPKARLRLPTAWRSSPSHSLFSVPRSFLDLHQAPSSAGLLPTRDAVFVSVVRFACVEERRTERTMMDIRTAPDTRSPRTFTSPRLEVLMARSTLSTVKGRQALSAMSHLQLLPCLVALPDTTWFRRTPRHRTYLNPSFSPRLPSPCHLRSHNTVRCRLSNISIMPNRHLQCSLLRCSTRK